MKNQKSQSEDIVHFWQMVFGDPPEYIRGYLERVPAEYRSLMYHSEELVSMVLGVPFQLRLWGELIPVTYDGSFAASPSVRGTGVAAETYKQLMRRYHTMGVVLNYGIMADEGLRSYYKRTFQFITPGMWRQCRWSRSDQKRTDERCDLIVEECADPLPWIEQFCQEIPHCLMPDEQTIALSRTDVRYFVAKDRDGGVVGIAGVDSTQLPQLYLLEAKEQSVVELFCRTIGALYQVEELAYRRYVGDTEERGLAYGRIIHAEKALRSWARSHQELTLVMAVTDEVIDENNRLYKIERGEVEVLLASAIPDRTVTIAELTEWIAPQVYMPVSYY